MNSTNDIFAMSLDDYIATKKDNFKFEDYNSKRYDRSRSQNNVNESNFKAERRPFKRAEIAEDDDEDMWEDQPVSNKTPRNNEKSFSGWRPRKSYVDLDCPKDEDKDPFELCEWFKNRNTSTKKEANQNESQQKTDVQNPLKQQQEQQSLRNDDDIIQRRHFYKKNAIRKAASGPYGCSNSNGNNRNLYQGYNEPGYKVNYKGIQSALDQINSSIYQSAIMSRTKSIECHCNADTTEKLGRAVQATEKNTAEAPKDLKTSLGVTDDKLTLAARPALPVLVSKFMDLLQVPQQQTIANKPKFDMEIQKKIHAMQGKPLRYICGTGNIVSSDGAGIANYRVKPHATGISLNSRFV